MSHISPPWVASSRMDHVFLESCRAPALLCYALFQLILILALDSKSVQCVCDIPLLYQYFYISIYRFS